MRHVTRKTKDIHDVLSFSRCRWEKSNETCSGFGMRRLRNPKEVPKSTQIQKLQKQSEEMNKKLWESANARQLDI